MLFTHPELLWGLLALILPVLVHLLRLRKFRKTPFTNVRVLQRLQLQADRSSQLKKWLLLAARLGLVAALVLAFAQPYRANPGATDPREVVIYLDNSFSMEATAGSTTLLGAVVQHLLRELPGDFRCAVLTNDGQYPVRSLDQLRQTLLGLQFTYQQANLETLQMRARPYFGESPGAQRELWLFSDFQGMGLEEADLAEDVRIRAVRLQPDAPRNMSLDTAYIISRGEDLLELQVNVSLQDDGQGSPISLFNADTLIAKSSADIGAGGSGSARFSLPDGQDIRGAVRILDEGLPYDNTLYFTLNAPERIKVMSLGPGDNGPLQRIYTPDEFEFTTSGIREVDFGRLLEQDLVVLNALETWPEALIQVMEQLLEQGAKLLVIPAREMDAVGYNRFLEPAAGWRIAGRVDTENRISGIRYDHPLFRDVFESPVDNFEYPGVRSYYQVEGSGPGILDFQNGEPFLLGSGNLFLLSASLDSQVSTFRESPLIVPVFYGVARYNLAFPELYFTIGEEASARIGLSQADDAVFVLEQPGARFIPEQQGAGRNTLLRFGSEPQVAGTYELAERPESGYRFSFNYPRRESQALRHTPTLPDGLDQASDVSGLLEGYQNSIRVTELWKWFVIFALIFAAAELLLQKFLR